METRGGKAVGREHRSHLWEPSGGPIQPGELFLFKLKSPPNVIGGYGVLS